MNTWNIIAAASVTAFLIAVGCSPAPVAPSGAGACNNQPNMAAALEHLHNARHALETAEHDKGGWRAKAQEATKVAIAETERGCAFADTH